MDVNSLYTNIPHADGVAACRTFLNKHNIQYDIATDIPILIDFIIKHDTLTFNDKYYLQTNGTAMGTKMSPAYAIIFMESVETSFIFNFFPLKPNIYYRDIDDIFMIWSHGIDKFKQFLSNANNTHTNNTFTYEASTALPYMDMLIKISNNTIYTTVYCKPTDRHSYLHYKEKKMKMRDF